MARARFWDVIERVDPSTGNLRPVANPVVSVYEAGTTTPLVATIYAGPTAGTTLSNPVTGDADGTVEFYLTYAQRVNLLVSGVGLGSYTIEYASVHGDVIDSRGGRVDRFAVGSTVAPADNLMLVSETVTEVPALGQSLAIETNVTGASTGGDYSALRVVMREMTSANNQSRPLEVHMMRTSGTGNQPTQGMELTIQGNVAESVAGFYHNALRIMSIPTTWSITGGVRQGNGIFIGQDEKGFENGILYRATAAESNVDLFKVDKVGQMTSGHHLSRGTDTYDLGSGANHWRALYANFAVVEQNSTFAAPSITGRTDTDTGLSWPSNNRIVFSANAGAIAEVNIGGVQTDYSLIGKKLASPATPASGYSALSPGTDEAWYRMTSGAVKVKLLDALDRVGARVTNSANQSIANNTFVPLTWNTEAFDTDTIHDTGTNTSRLTCKTAGRYSITGFGYWATSAAGTVRILEIILNGTGVYVQSNVPPIAGGVLPTTQIVSLTLTLAVNDYVELYGFQDSGGALNMIGGQTYAACFEMHRVMA